MSLINIILIFPLVEEFKIFSDICEIIDTQVCDAIHYHTLKIPETEIFVKAVILPEMGPTVSSQVTEKVINYLEPNVIILLGIAGSLDAEIKLGDIVIANEINEFQAKSKAVNKDNSFEYQYSGNHWKTSHRFTQFLDNFQFSASARTSYKNWQEKMSNIQTDYIDECIEKRFMSNSPKIYIGHIASGDIVSSSEKYAVELKGIDRKFLAIEMEAAGIAQAASSREEQVEIIVMRGISDFADSRKEKFDSIGNGKYRKYAICSISYLLLELLKSEHFRNMLDNKYKWKPMSERAYYEARDYLINKTEMLSQDKDEILKHFKIIKDEGNKITPHKLRVETSWKYIQRKAPYKVISLLSNVIEDIISRSS